jgi:hypothetical protein
VAIGAVDAQVPATEIRIGAPHRKDRSVRCLGAISVRSFPLFQTPAGFTSLANMLERK